MSVREDVKLAVERAAGGAKANYLESVTVTETFNGETVWEGIVELFHVATKPAVTGYGWAVESLQGSQFVAVLGNPPIDSPIKAVRAWIISQVKK